MAGIFPTFGRFRHISIFLKKKGKDIEKREKEEKARNNVRNVRMSEKKLETRMDKRSTVSDIDSDIAF